MTVTPQPPDHLTEHAKVWFSRIVAEFVIEDALVELLRKAAEALDLADQHLAIIKTEGPTVVDRFKQVREHPSGKAFRDSVREFRNSIKDLGLLDTDAEPHAAGRPPAAIAQKRG